MKTGWLSPTGEWYPCPVYDHLTLARKLADTTIRPDDVLIDRRWVKITISQLGRKEWRIYWHNRLGLTPEQKQFLKPYFESDSDFPVDDWTRYFWEVECNETLD